MDRPAFGDRRLVGADIGEDRRAAPLGAVARRVLHLEAFEEEGGAQHAAGGDDALAAASMESDAIHLPPP